MFEKGKAKTGGRTKGTPNKANQVVKGILEQVLTDKANVEKLKADFQKLSPKDFLNAYTSLVPFVLPRLANASLEVDLEKLSDEDLDALYNRIIQGARQ